MCLTCTEAVAERLSNAPIGKAARYQACNLVFARREQLLYIGLRRRLESNPGGRLRWTDRQADRFLDGQPSSRQDRVCPRCVAEQ
jgi:hypothetical protein